MNPRHLPLKNILLAMLCAAAGAGSAALLWPARAPLAKTDVLRGPAPPPPVTTSQRAMTPKTAALLQAIREAGTPSQQMAAALRLSQLGSPEEIRALLEHARSLPAHTARDLAVQTLLKRWLDFDPEAAVEYCRRHEEKQLSKLIGSWAALHPGEAEAYVLTLPSGEAWRRAWSALCEAAAARSPGEAWRLLQRMPSEVYLREGFYRRILGDDPQEAAAQLENLPPHALHPAQRAVARLLTEKDPAAAWEWALSRSGADSLASEVFRHGLAQNPAQALAMLAALPAEERRVILTHMHVQQAPAGEIAQALRNDTALTVEEKQRLASRVFGMASRTDPAAAQALLPFVPANSLASSMKSYLDTRSRRDPAAAEAWMSGLPQGPLREAAETAWQANAEEAANPPDRTSPQSFVAQAAGYVERDDPRLANLEASHVAELMASADGPPPFAENILSGLAAQNPSAAAEWLATVEVDQKTGPMAAQFSTAWAMEDPAAAAAWARALPEGPLARTAAQNIARQYHVFAPDEAKVWAESLPAGPVKDAALTGLGGE